MFGFQDSKGTPDIPQSVAELATLEEQLPVSGAGAGIEGGAGEGEQAALIALLPRLRFRKNLLNVCSFASLPLLPQEMLLHRCSLISQNCMSGALNVN